MVMSSAEVVWHDLECGSYAVDLPLWRELAGRSSLSADPARILDVGAGTGRVAVDLARAGHCVTALEIDTELLDALRARTVGVDVEALHADARNFDLGRTDFDLCLMPMQTIQLLGGPTGRVEFLRRARAHLRPGGLLAIAIVTTVEPFDCTQGEVGPSPEIARVDGALYVTRAIRVCVLEDSVLIERERQIDGDRGPGRDVIELDRVSAAELEREAIGVGLDAEPARELPPTRDHVGSTVVMLRG